MLTVLAQQEFTNTGAELIQRKYIRSGYMLSAIKDDVATIKCGKCNNEFDVDLSNITCEFSDEFNEYENLYVTCEKCGTVEVFNMNIPVDDVDEDFKTGDLPVSEEIQRHYVRILQRLVRGDFK